MLQKIDTREKHNKKCEIHLSEIELFDKSQWKSGPEDFDIWINQKSIDFIAKYGSDYWALLDFDNCGGDYGTIRHWHIILPQIIKKYNN